MQGFMQASGCEQQKLGAKGRCETGRVAARPPCSNLVLALMQLSSVWLGRRHEWIGLVIVALIVAVRRERHSAKDFACLRPTDGDEMTDGVVAIVIAVAGG